MNIGPITILALSMCSLFDRGFAFVGYIFNINLKGMCAGLTKGIANLASKGSTGTYADFSLKRFIDLGVSNKTQAYISKQARRAFREARIAVEAAYMAGSLAIQGHYKSIPSVEKMSNFLRQKTSKAQTALEILSTYLSDNPEMLTAIEKAKIGVVSLSVLGFAYIVIHHLNNSDSRTIASDVTLDHEILYGRDD